MKSLKTSLCCICFAVMGVCIASVGNRDKPNEYNTIMASPLPTVPIIRDLPLDLQLDQSLRNKKDTVIIKDTVKVTTKPKKIKVPYKIVKRDTIYQSVYFVLIPEGREEQPSDSNYCIPKVHIKDTLSRNVNHSTIIE